MTEILVPFLTLTFLEVVLGIDNVIFISILSNRFEGSQRNKLMRIGLLLAMCMRIVLLFGIAQLIRMQEPFLHLDTSFIKTAISWQALIFFFGGAFLIYKSSRELFYKVERVNKVEEATANGQSTSGMFSKVLLQIVLIDIVFSFDSILMAVGMTSGIPYAFWIMVAAIVVSVMIIMGFATPLSRFVNTHPSLQVLGLTFLLIIGVLLISEAGHLSHTRIWGTSIDSIPKSYLYFGIAFSLLVEFLNMRMRRNKKETS